jgi:hypothetical protein
MKKLMITLAAAMALSSSAMASEMHKPASTATGQASVCAAATGAKLDCTSTKSISKVEPAANNATSPKNPRLGINIDPWIAPTTF